MCSFRALRERLLSLACRRLFFLYVLSYQTCLCPNIPFSEDTRHTNLGLTSVTLLHLIIAVKMLSPLQSCRTLERSPRSRNTYHPCFCQEHGTHPPPNHRATRKGTSWEETLKLLNGKGRRDNTVEWMDATKIQKGSCVKMS